MVADPPHRSGAVAIVGRPSVGKSTLINRLVRQKLSITSKKPQTTRHRINGILTEDARQFVFVDTPGFQTRQSSLLNERMNRLVRSALADVDAVVWVVDARRIVAADRDALSLVPADVPTIAALNKVDALADKALLLPRIDEVAKLRHFAAIVPISAERDLQIDRLKDAIAAVLPEAPAMYPHDQITDRDERFIAAEFVREKIFRSIGDEVPYSTAVTIDRFEEVGSLRRIFASVLVDKPGQRAILLGHRGERMKAIASAARVDLERALGGTVHLEVWVRVRKGWADEARSLTRLGY
ncbi:MAG TPA: GTPase Era [Casimicrobiaceae bacterium]|nr:GTPase Era [Casimicrobiaceae bacterium]